MDLKALECLNKDLDTRASVRFNNKKLKKAAKLLKIGLTTAKRILFSAYHLAAFTLASTFVLSVIYQPQLDLIRGESVPGQGNDPQANYMIHELFPHASWNDLEPCGLHFDEQKEFNTALQCVNKNVWPDSPITDSTVTHIPRCFIVKAKTVDVYTKPEIGFNFIPIFEPTPMGIEVGAVVGVYQPETRTVYIIENVDAPMIYRHELQHYFLHAHNPETGGGGHHQEIWQKCEPPYYDPSDKVKAGVKPAPTEKKSK